ncbi:glycosyltransferase [Vibrio cholerae]|uniref:glycosyltransferase n=2 Tax=Vibrio cholerae TaxID=666 RepID=UPI001A9CD248|nr:glycosyltransferase [Vibrio cholerae]MBO1366895.1 hypothetical protein [Vibrio cholerae]MBO1370067.1 hypothetical protein [Vibrio cholerae]MBO1373028.1 hypothetical protein [Vibrio cholerae]MBO1377415.1 hypothetical protein [Vibrio cholerae]MBO1406807.1 hypothetical protein [Vibrio cholerae]
MKVLQLSTYPIKVPRHGGQIRVDQIGKKLQSLGYDVKHLSFSELSHKYFNKESDFIMDDVLLRKEITTLYSTDLATAIVCEKNTRCLNFLIENLKKFKPDFIFLEQPWLWPAVKKIRTSHPELINKIIYSSQNVEFLTKKTLFESNNVEDIDDVVSKIEDIEIDLLNNSSSVIACTKSDAEQFLSLALADLQPIICPNGVSEFTKNSEVAILRNQLKKKLGDKKYALFVGSAYPPNAQGFWDNLGHSMGWLSMDEFIFSVGGCSNILEHFMPKNRDISSYVNFDKIKRLGFVTDNELTALIQEASVIILPISDGGGSNLKTAEAILSGKPVVATKMACRGYDRIAEYSNFSIREPGTDFINEVKRYLQLVPDELSVKELELRKEVTWEHALSSLGMIINT